MAPFNKKITSAFTRRKSASNALDDASTSPSTTRPPATAPEGSSSFRVIPRDTLDNRRTGGRPVISFDERADTRLRGSHASSAFTRVGADTASSSLRYSSASTVPSSFEIEDPFSPSRQTNMNAPTSLRSPAGSPEPNKIEDSTTTRPYFAGPRERRMTTSSYASTAVAPKLETAIPVSEGFEDLGNIFAGFEERKKISDGSERKMNGRPEDHNQIRADDERKMVSDLEERQTNITRPVPAPHLTQLPERAFLRADSEPTLPTRKPVGSFRSDVAKMPSPTQLQFPTRVDTTLSTEAPKASPGLLARRSTDNLMYSSSPSRASSPESPPPVPPHLQQSLAIHNGSSHQTLSSSSENEAIVINPSHTPSKTSTQSTVVQRGVQSRDVPSNPSTPAHSRLNSSDSFNTSALAYADSTPKRAGTRKMTQKDFEALQKQERNEEKMRMRRGEELDNDDLAEYDDDPDEEELKKMKRQRERQQAMLSVHRQSVARSVGRDVSETYSSVDSQATGGADPPPNHRTSSSPEFVSKQDQHLLQYAHNTPNLQPPNLADYINRPATHSTPNLPTSKLSQSSGDDDDDVPLAMLQQAKLMKQDPDAQHRVSTAGSLARGSASIAPSMHGSLTPQPRPRSGGSTISRPNSRTSKQTYLPPMARGLPLAEDLPLIPGFQQGFGQNPQAPLLSPAGQYGQQMNMQQQSPQPQITYQNNFGGQYTPATGMPGAPTLMDSIQQEERAKKSRKNAQNQSAQQQAQQAQQRTMSMGNMPHPNMGMANPYQQMQQAQALGMPMQFNPYQMALLAQMQMQNPMLQQQMMSPEQMMALSQQAMLGAQMQNMSMQNMPMGQMNSSNHLSPADAYSNREFVPKGSYKETYGRGMPLATIPGSPRHSNVLPAPAHTSGLPAGYAPSIAPSERSNIGIASRYRSVTTGDAISVTGSPMPASAAPAGAGEGQGGDGRKKGGVKAWLGRRTGGMDGAEEEEDYDAEGEGDEWSSMRRGRARRGQVGA